MTLDSAERTRILAQLQRRLRELLAPALAAALDELEKRLFDLAERSRVGAQQQAFFDGLRECRRKRADVEHGFNESVAALLRPASAQSALAPRTGLSLIANDELEETLSLSAMADRVANRLARELAALDVRLEQLVQLPPTTDETARLGPQALSNAFRGACQRLDAGIEIRLVAYAVFGHHVLGALERIYAQLNALLSSAGIGSHAQDPTAASGAAPVPAAHRRAPVRRRATDKRPEDETSAAAEQASDPETAQALDAIDAMQELLGALRAVIASGAPAPGISDSAQPAANDVTAGERALPPRYVLGALDRLQDFHGEPHRLKSELLATSRHLRADRDAVLRADDEDTVDVVGLVFDFVRHDPNLPEALQPLLARLQIPFLKAALTDPELLKVSHHPARLLIDELGELALGWSLATDPEQQIPTRIARTIDALLDHGNAGPASFEQAIKELRMQLDVGRRRAELAEQRAVEAALGRERLRIARARVAATLDRRLSQYSPLPWVRQLLRGPWANYLVLCWLRHGESSESFRAALGFVDELLWCDEHGASNRDELRLRADATRLGDELRHGLATVAYHDQEIERLGAELHMFVTSLQLQAPPPSFLYEIDPKLGTADFALNWIEHEIEDQPDAEAIDTAMVARVRSLPPGTWFEFGPAAGGERAKLSWSSPFSGRCLLVNRNGLRVSELAPERLAAELERGVARILENSRLLQRALATLLQKVRTQGPAALRPSA